MKKTPAFNIENPFVGLRPFDENEKHLFFGRDRQISEILNLLAENHFISVIGDSGAGKSSLIRAGIIPGLKAGMLTQFNEEWVTVYMRPGDRPLQNFFLSLSEALRSIGIVIKKSEVERSFKKLGSPGVVSMLEDFRVLENKKIFILVDQFEELFRFKSEGFDVNAEPDAEHREFINLVLYLTSKHLPVPFYTITTMRSEYLGDCSVFRNLPETMNKSQYLVPNLTRSEIKECIINPIRSRGATIDRLLLNEVLGQIADRIDQLPVLQHALMRTWDFWIKSGAKGTTLIHEHYRKAGGISSALEQHANQLYERFNKYPEKQEALQKILRWITDLGTKKYGIRRPMTLESIILATGTSRKTVLQVLAPFRKQNVSMIVPLSRQGIRNKTVVDISHESVMRVWTRLKEWTIKEREDADILRKLSFSTKELKKEGRFIGEEVDFFFRWQKEFKPTGPWAERYIDNFEESVQFLKDSKANYDKQLKEQEDIKLAAAQAEAIKEEQKKQQHVLETELRVQEQTLAKKHHEEQESLTEEYHKGTKRKTRIQIVLVIIVLGLLVSTTITFNSLQEQTAAISQLESTYDSTLNLYETLGYNLNQITSQRDSIQLLAGQTMNDWNNEKDLSENLRQLLNSSEASRNLSENQSNRLNKSLEEIRKDLYQSMQKEELYDKELSMLAGYNYMQKSVLSIYNFISELKYDSVLFMINELEQEVGRDSTYQQYLFQKASSDTLVTINELLDRVTIDFFYSVIHNCASCEIGPLGRHILVKNLMNGRLDGVWAIDDPRSNILFRKIFDTSPNSGNEDLTFLKFSNTKDIDDQYIAFKKDYWPQVFDLSMTQPISQKIVFSNPDVGECYITFSPDNSSFAVYPKYIYKGGLEVSIITKNTNKASSDRFSNKTIVADKVKQSHIRVSFLNDDILIVAHEEKNLKKGVKIEIYYLGELIDQAEVKNSTLSEVSEIIIDPPYFRVGSSTFYYDAKGLSMQKLSALEIPTDRFQPEEIKDRDIYQLSSQNVPFVKAWLDSLIIN